MRRKRTKLLAAAIGLLPITNLFAGKVTTDGSLGTASNLSGPNFAVPSTLGKQSGNNLFHSFSTFNLSSGETATFSGPIGINNVISRVTGGTASTIDGTIRCSIPNANFYLINPAGVMFTSNAQLDVKGSFVVTTANYLKFADGNKFLATTDTTLSSAAPSAFGFLGGKPAAINVNGATLAVTSGNSLSLVGGDVKIVNGVIQAPSGRVNLASSASSGEIGFDPTSLLANIDLTPGITLGDVAVSSSGIDVSVATGGRVSVRVAALEVSNSQISANTTGSGNGLGIDITLTGDAMLAPVLMTTDSTGSGKAGPVTIFAGNITIDGSGFPALTTGISASASSTGAGGDISLSGKSVSLTNGSALFPASLGPGNGGSVSILATGDVHVDKSAAILAIATASGRAANVTINADTLEVTGGAAISASTSGTGNAGHIGVTARTISVDNANGNSNNIGIVANSLSSGAGGSAGTIVVNADSVSITNGAIIGASTTGLGSAGSVMINGGSVTVDPGSSTLNTGILAVSFNSNAGGNAGTVSMTGSSLQLLGGAVMTADSEGLGLPGTVTVNASNIVLDGRALDLSSTPFGGTGILARSTTTSSSAPGGQILVQADTISIVDGGQISVESFAGGNAGNATVNATQSLSIDGKGHLLPTGIFADSLSGAGNAGNLSISAPTLSVVGGGSIAASSFGTGGLGSITITANTSLTIDGQGLQLPTGIFSEADAGASGSILITAGTVSVAGGAEISSSSFGAGTGGTLTMNVQSMTVGNSIIASRTFSTGDAGTVNITANNLAIISGGEITSGTSGNGKGGVVNITANTLVLNGIDAAATIDTVTAGVNGTNGVTAAGDGGAINIHANSIQLLSGGAISAFSLGDGKGGQITINAGSVAIDTTGSTAVTGILASSLANGNAGNVSVQATDMTLKNHAQIKSDANAAGNAGAISVTADTLSIASESIISSGTFSTGAGGDVTISGKKLFIDAKGAKLFTGITAQTQDAGAAGSVHINENSVQLTNGGEISSTTFGTGPGGSVSISAKTLTLKSNSFIDSASSQTATAGVVNIDLTRKLVVNHSHITSEALHGTGGGIDISARNRVNIHSSQITTQAGGEGGSISIRSRGTIDILNSQILTQAGDNGGNMVVDPSFVLLQNSRLSANGGNNGGNITINPDFLLQTQSTITATGTRGVSGTLEITPIYNLTGALLSLPASLSDALTLQPQCAADLAGNVSSFIVTGRGGQPLTPGGFIPAFDLRLPPKQP